MMKITGLSHLFKWENLHNWWLTKYFFAPLYIFITIKNIFVFRIFISDACNDYRITKKMQRMAITDF